MAYVNNNVHTLERCLRKIVLPVPGPRSLIWPVQYGNARLLHFVSLSDRSDTPIKEKPPASGKIEGVSNVIVLRLPIKSLLCFPDATRQM